MKNISKIFATLLIFSGMVFLFGCKQNNFDVPPTNVPKVNFTANTLLTGLNKYYTDSLGGTLGIIKSNIIIKGKIVANDSSGNIYKELYFEDDSAGCQVALDQSYLYETYALGQRIYIKCQGLYMGSYGGVPELGYLSSGAIGRIPAAMMPGHVFLDSLPGPVPAPKLLTIPQLTPAQYNMLVRIDSLSFMSGDVGQPFATATANTNHTLLDINVNTIVLRTSNYATFAATTVPSGTGSIIGILSAYNGTWQIYIRNLNDLIGF